MKKNFAFLAAMTVLLAFVSSAFAVVDDSFLQWPLNGSEQSNGADVRVYSQVMKVDCTGMCDSTECADLTATMYYRAEGGSWMSGPMSLNMGDCYTPYDEYIFDIPLAALTGTFVDFYAEFSDADGAAVYHSRFDQAPEDYDATTPAQFLLSNATTAEFTLTLCGNFMCVAPNGAGPGVSGTFNGWTYAPLPDVTGDVYCTDIVIPVGSDPNLQFKFRNGNDWEPIPSNREYTIASGATSDTFVDFWAFESECTCPEAPLTADKQVVFTVDMSNQDPALYVGGVSIQGSRAPLTWTPGATPMTDQGGGIFTTSLTFATGTLNTVEYKFTANSIETWNWEGIGNRQLCLEDNGTLFPNPTQYWNNEEPSLVTTVDIDVTFRVDMNCLDMAAYAGGVSAQGSLAPLTWTPGENMLSDGDADGIYEGTLTFPAGSTFDGEYKFTKNDGVDWGWEDNVANRSFTLSDSNPNMILDVQLWDGWFCSPTVMATVAGPQVHLDWDDVPTATGYTVYGSMDPFFVPAPELEVGFTVDSFFDVTYTIDQKMFYKVKASDLPQE